MRRRAVGLVVAAALGVAVACVDEIASSKGLPRIVVINTTAARVLTDVRMKLCGAPEWDADLLGAGETIPPAARDTFRLARPADGEDGICYDLRVGAGDPGAAGSDSSVWKNIKINPHDDLQILVER